MPRAAKSPSKSPAKPRSSRSPQKKSKLFIDDEAGDSDADLNLQYPDSDPDFPAVLAPAHAVEPQPAQDDSYDVDFINDGDPFDGASDHSEAVTPPPPTQSRSARKRLVASDDDQPAAPAQKPRRAPKVNTDSDTAEPVGSTKRRLAKKQASDGVIELTSSDEDLEALAEDDSMFRKPSGVKAAALPSPLKTRSSAKRSLPADDVEATAPRPSPVKKTKRSAELTFGTAGSASEMTKFMSEFMTAFMAQNFPGLNAASAPPAVAASPSKTRALVRTFSPDWDGPYGADVLPETPSTPSPSRKTVSTKGKGRASSSSSKKQPPRALAEEDVEDVDSEVLKFMNSPVKSGKQPLTMGEYLKSDKPTPVAPTGEISTVFLEDIETYKAYFDPSAPCQVFDLELQDPVLRSTYPGLAPLPSNKQILPAYDPNRNAGIEPVKGGRVKYRIWGSYIPDMLVDNSRGAVLFDHAAPSFINPSRVSPVRLSSRVSTGSATTYRLHVDDRVAICVSSLFCAESKLVSPAKIGGKSERLRKWLAGIFHNQEWERFESLICLVFGEQVMRAQISPKKAVSFQTMISPDNANDKFDSAAPADMFAPIVSTSATKLPTTPSRFSSARGKTLLAHDDRIPIYDARKVVVDFDADLTRLDELLPPFVGEVPFGSFVVVGYTCAMYHATISGASERVPHLGCNILWVIVCGVPKLKR